MERDVSSGSDSGEDFLAKWYCDVCKLTPIDAHKLDRQLLYNETVILFDSNQDEWVRCTRCDKRFHVKCVKNLPQGVCQCFFRFCGWNMYVCSKCY